MSTIIIEFTKEQLIAKAREQIAFCRNTKITGEGRTHVNQCSALFEIALASLEAEAVAYIFQHPAGRLFWSLTDESNKGQSDVMPVYSAPVPAFVPPAIEPDYEVIKGILPTANPDEYACCIAADMWNACRAAMLQGVDGALTDEDTKRVDELVMWIKRLAHSLRKSNPDSKLQSDAMDYLSRKGVDWCGGYTAMMTDKDLTDDVLDEIIAGAKTSMEQYLALSLKAERAANRQQNQQQNIPENIPNLREAVKTIRNSGIAIDGEKILAERDDLNSPVIPGCSCHVCRPVTFTDSRFVVCPVCGNKRCPHANDHRNACSGSNEPGQEGSAYPAAPQQEVKQCT